MKQTKRSVSLPKSWPAHIIYITEPVFSKHLTPEQLLHIHKPTNPAASSVTSKTTAPAQNEANPLVKIVAVADKAHPAYGQSSLVATRALPPDAHIIDYIGFVHGEKDTNAASDYDISLDRENQVAVDAAKRGNEARFINDYRGVSPDGPNAEFRDSWVPVAQMKQGKQVTVWQKRVAVYVLSPGKSKSKKRARGIAKGEEILVSYGKGFWGERKADAREDEDEDDAASTAEDPLL